MTLMLFGDQNVHLLCKYGRLQGQAELVLFPSLAFTDISPGSSASS